MKLGARSRGLSPALGRLRLPLSVESFGWVRPSAGDTPVNPHFGPVADGERASPNYGQAIVIHADRIGVVRNVRTERKLGGNQYPQRVPCRGRGTNIQHLCGRGIHGERQSSGRSRIGRKGRHRRGRWCGGRWHRQWPCGGHSPCARGRQGICRGPVARTRRGHGPHDRVGRRRRGCARGRPH